MFAATACTTMRDDDIVGRFGGEEFAAVVPGKLADAMIAAERVRAAFQAIGDTICDCNINATVSIGVACGEPGAEVEAILAAADAALYRAKGKGRNRVVAAEELVPAAVRTRTPQQLPMPADAGADTKLGASGAPALAGARG